MVTDHSPSTADLKTDDFATSWGGISGLQLSLSRCGPRRAGADTAWRTWSAGVRTHGTAGGLDTRKGAIETGRDADLVVFAPDETFTWIRRPSSTATG